jgi:diamine N-acetyltransferase
LFVRNKKVSKFEPMKIKKVTEKQLPALVELARSTFVAAFAEENDPADFAIYVDNFFTLDVFKKEFDTEGSVFYMAYDNSTLIGYFKLNHGKIPHDAMNPIPEFEDLTAHPTSGRFETSTTLIKSTFIAEMTELERFYLIPETHGKGFALQMMQQAEVLTAKIKSTYLWLGVWEHNLKACKFYEKAGFTKFAEHLFIIGTDAQTDWLMWKKM